MAVIISLAVVIGWAADIDAAKTVLPGYPEMKPVGAGGFLLLAFGLCLSVQDGSDRSFRWATPVIGSIVAVASLIILGKYFFQVSNDISAVLVPDLGPIAGTPGSKISPISAFSFISIGVSMALVRSARLKQVSGIMAACVLLATYAALLGHLYQADTLYGFSDTNGMPLHTGFLFILIGVALLRINRDFHLVRLLVSDSIGGAAARKLIPVVVVIPTAIGWLRLTGQEHGLYDMGFGTALSTFALVSLTLSIVLYYSRTIHLADIKRRDAEIELADKETRYRLLVDHGQGSISTHDLNGTLLMINPAGTRVLGYEEHEMVGHDLRTFMPRRLHSAFSAYLGQVRHDGFAEGIFSMVAKDGKVLTFRFHNVLINEDGAEPYVLGHAQDVTELLAAQTELKNLSLTDDLTGLYNRRGFLTMAEHQLKLEKHTGTARGLTLLFADMDGLKAVNDTYGHEAGSNAIKTLGRLIASVVRSADLVARWGGDEFVILSVGTQGENVQLVIDRILETIDEHNAESGEPYLIACSIGAAAIDLDRGATLDEVIAEADAAMYVEKKRRKEAVDEVSNAPRSFMRPWAEYSPRPR